MAIDKDSIVRITARDLFISLMLFKKNHDSTIENVRLRLCVDRKKRRRGTYLWSTARDTVSELRRLGLIEGGPLPRDHRKYQDMSGNKLSLTSGGKCLIERFYSDKADAYDQLFSLMFQEHLYLRNFVKIVTKNQILAPVLTSVKEHISSRYSSTTILADDISNGRLDTENLISSLASRIGRELEKYEKNQILQNFDILVAESQVSSSVDDLSDFAKKFLIKLNEIVIPGIFQSNGLGFDYRTHRTLWTLGQEFLVWWATTSHPAYDGLLIFPTAAIQVSDDGNSIKKIVFDSGLENIDKDFLSKLYSAYHSLQKLKNLSYVAAWELRSVFCYENRCQPSIFNKLFDKYYTGSKEFRLHLEIQRSKPRNEESLLAGKRKIGTVRVTKG